MTGFICLSMFEFGIEKMTLADEINNIITKNAFKIALENILDPDGKAERERIANERFEELEAISLGAFGRSILGDAE